MVVSWNVSPGPNLGAGLFVHVFHVREVPPTGPLPPYAYWNLFMLDTQADSFRLTLFNYDVRKGQPPSI